MMKLTLLLYGKAVIWGKFIAITSRLKKESIKEYEALIKELGILEEQFKSLKVDTLQQIKVVRKKMNEAEAKARFF